MVYKRIVFKQVGFDDDCIPPKDTSPHQDSTGTAFPSPHGHSLQRHTAAGTATPTTADTG